MKKIIILIITILVVCTLGGIFVYDKLKKEDVPPTNENNKPNDEVKVEDEELTLDEFLNKLQGYWASVEMRDSNVSISFENNKFILGYFASDAAIITNITAIEKTDDAYSFTDGNNKVYIDLKEIDSKVMYVKVNENSYQKYVFAGSSYDEAFEYFFNQ